MPALAHRLEDTQDGNLVEICPALEPIAAALGQRIETNGGTALIIDYGDWRSLGDTLQALKDHKFVDPFEAPGTGRPHSPRRLRGHRHAAPCAHSRLTPQGVFLERLGITARAQALAAQQLTGDKLDSHIAAHRRLTHPDEMGNLFKVLALFPTHGAPPPGCET